MNIYEFKPDDAFMFASAQGIKTRQRGDELQFQMCPYCRSTKDKYTFSINLQNGMHKCLRSGCAKQGNMITLAQDFDFSLGTEGDEYYNPRRRFRNLRHYPKPTVKDAAVAYLESRGISEAITRKYQLTVRKDNDGILIFPFYDEKNQLQFIKYRNMHPAEGQSKEWCERDCKPILFGMDHCDPDNSGMLVLTEGQIDSLSVAEAFDGDINVVSVPTGAKGFTWVPYCWDFLNKFKTLVVFGDYENGHITLLEEMKKRFNGSVRHVDPDRYQECKDANELLQKHGKQAVVDAVTYAVLVANPRIKEIKDIERKDQSKLPRFRSGIREIDKLTEGGLRLGTVMLLTGERGNGKSTFASQIGTFAIRAGYNTIFYSGELLDWYFREWLDRQVAGDRYINANRSNLGYTTYSVKDDAIEKINDWYAGKAFLYDNSMLGDDGEDEESLLKTIEDAIKQYNCGVIILDNLMTAMSDDFGADLYRQQTKFVKTLVKMAQFYQVLIILIVHPRKRNGLEFSNDDVSGSSNITNLADLVIRYTRPKKEDADADDRKRILQVLKNRTNGRILPDGIPVYFQPSSKRISEDELFDWELGWEHSSDGWNYDTEESDIPFD